MTSSLFSGPSIGAKGGLLLVDSHFDPMRHTDAAADALTGVLDNFPSRMTSSDVAFTTWGTSEATDCFVVDGPSDQHCTTHGNRGAVEPYTTRIVYPTAARRRRTTDWTSVRSPGTGNPGDAGVDYDVSMEIRRNGLGDQYAHVYVTPAQP